jgi:transposase
LVALIQTPHRFRSKRQFWSYIGLALKTCTIGEQMASISFIPLAGTIRPYFG